MAHELLSKVVGVLDSHKIDYWLDYGSLLGAVREHDFVDTDIDIDISFFAEQDITPVLRDLRNNQLEFSSDYIQTGDRTLLRKANILVEGKHSAFAKLELVPSYYHPLTDKYYKLTGKDGEMLLGAGVPSVFFTMFKEVDFRGIKVKIPTRDEGLLEFHYGDWKIPDSKGISKTYKDPFTKLDPNTI